MPDTIKKRIAMPVEVKDISATEPRTLILIGSTQGADRDDDIIDAQGWELDNYIKNPIVLWAHDYWQPPVAQAKAVFIDPRSGTLNFKVYFPTVEELTTKGAEPSEHALFVDTLYNMYKMGMLNATSVGFIAKEWDRREDQRDLPEWQRGTHFFRQELLELSCVPVPANAEALVQARGMKGLAAKALDVVSGAIAKGAIPFRHYPLAPADETWDAGKEVGDATVDDLKIMCAWYDSENADLKGSYKFPHHTLDGYKTVRAAVNNALARLKNSNIPESDKEAVKAHLEKHSQEFKDEEEGKSFKGGYMPEGLTAEEVAKLKALVAPKVGEKGNRKLSAASLERVNKAMEHAGNCVEELKALVSDGVVEDDDDTSDGVEEGKALDLAALTLEDANKMLAKGASAKE